MLAPQFGHVQAIKRLYIQMYIHKYPLDTLYILWACCLIAHYQETDRKLSKNNIVADFNESTFILFEATCEVAYHRGFVNRQQQLTQKGLVAVEHWQAITARIYEV